MAMAISLALDRADVGLATLATFWITYFELVTSVILYFRTDKLG